MNFFQEKFFIHRLFNRVKHRNRLIINQLIIYKNRNFCKKSVVSGQPSVVSGQRSVVRSQTLTADHC